MAGGECKGDCESEGREDSVMVREAVLDLYIQSEVGVRSYQDALYIIRGSNSLT